MLYKHTKLGSLIGLLLFILACSAFPGSSPTEEPASADVATQPPTEEPIENDDSIVSSGGMPVTGEGLCANAYYTVRDGATWEYFETSSMGDSLTFTDSISSIREDGFTLTSQYDELTRTQEWACRPEGLVAIQMGGDAAGGLSTPLSQLTIDTQTASGVTYPVVINPGDTWQYLVEFTGTMEIAGQAGNAEGTAQSDYTAIGVESVTVPAGMFDAMKLEIETTINITVIFQGLTVPVEFTGTSTSWIVQGVGWVKTESTGDFSGEAFTDTMELQSYSIP